MESRFRFNLHIVLLIVTLIVVSALIIPSISSVKFAAAYDEGYYLRYAQHIAENGISGFRYLFENYATNEEHWHYPSPLRIGFIIMSSIAIKLFGNNYLSLAYLSFFSYLLFIIVTFVFCKRFYDQDKAILVTLLVAFSPMQMAMARRALSESFLMLFLGLSIWLFLDLVQNKDKNPTKKLLFIVVFTFTILIKETSVLLVGPFLVYMIIYKILHKESFKVTKLLPYILVYPGVLTGLVYLFLTGGLLHFAEMVKILFISPATNPYNLYCSGPWFRYLIDYMLLSPWTLLLCGGYIFYTLRDFRKRNETDIYFGVIFIGGLFIFSIFIMNIRYVMFLDMTIRLFTVLMLYMLIPVKSERMKFLIVIGIVVILCISNFHTFHDMFIKKNLYDPTSFLLLEMRHLIPVW